MEIEFSLIGSDLEYAVQTLKGEIVPAGLLDTMGMKGYPEPLKLGGIEIDCCALETTPNPSSTEDGFVRNILGVLTEVREKYKAYRFLTKPSHKFTSEVLEATRYANVMGCSPDFNVWTGEMNPKPSPAAGLRSYGGHIHIESATDLTVKACDLTLGMWSVLEDDDMDRRSIYGKAGAFRPKSYGREYRVLSSFWCAREDHIRTVFRLARKAQAFTGQQVFDAVMHFGGAAQVQEIINSGNRVKAQKVFNYMVA